MSRQHRQHIEFINRFVDSVTIRPFFDDLRRSSTTAQLSVPRPVRRVEAAANEAA